MTTEHNSTFVRNVVLKHGFIDVEQWVRGLEIAGEMSDAELESIATDAEIEAEINEITTFGEADWDIQPVERQAAPDGLTFDEHTLYVQKRLQGWDRTAALEFVLRESREAA